ncbi:Scr1 family TA system antitoxin-like transcriptional regulator [Streptomyces sp. NPDC090306]|uniref:helix-turn-helix domain-containing protein n=1 Tax=Streptomyces sp. NPDC090306 TaxID=3365961 RepID=UPI0037FDD3A0
MAFTPRALTPYLSARHYFGSELRRHREIAGLSLVQLAGIVNSSKSTLARIETAELMPPPDLPDRLDAAFGTDKLFHGLYQLAKREAHPDQYRRFMDFEAEAEVVENYGSQVLPGILQTREYARALLCLQEELSTQEVESRVNARIARQERLHDAGAPERWAIIDESVLRRIVGGPACMRYQLASLLAQVDTSTSKVQVMPLSAGPHSLMGGALTLLTLPQGSTVAYEEGIEVGHLYEARSSVKNWRRRYEILRANALSPAASAELIQQAMEDFEPCDTPPS